MCSAASHAAATTTAAAKAAALPDFRKGYRTRRRSNSDETRRGSRVACWWAYSTVRSVTRMNQILMVPVALNTKSGSYSTILLFHTLQRSNQLKSNTLLCDVATESV